MLGRTCLHLIHPDDREAVQTENGLLAAGHTTKRIVNRFRHRDGSYR